MKNVSRPTQLTLFAELVEVQITRDVVTGDATWIKPPPGRGWRVSNADRQRHTEWMRRRPVVLPRRRRT